MIPTAIHQFWTGESIPPQFVENSQNLERINKHWDFYRWDESSVGELINQKVYDNAQYFISEGRENVMRSNVVRAELLLVFGGIYVDYDWIATAPFDDLPKVDHIVATSEYGPDPMVLGCTAGNRLAEGFTREIGVFRGPVYSPGCIALREVLDKEQLYSMDLSSVGYDGKAC